MNSDTFQRHFWFSSDIFLTEFWIRQFSDTYMTVFWQFSDRFLQLTVFWQFSDRFLTVFLNWWDQHSIRVPIFIRTHPNPWRSWNCLWLLFGWRCCEAAEAIATVVAATTRNLSMTMSCFVRSWRCPGGWRTSTERAGAAPRSFINFSGEEIGKQLSPLFST